MTANRPFPESSKGHRRPLALACAASLLFHGGVLAAAHWGWESVTPLRIPPMVAIPVIDAARLKAPAAAPATAAPPASLPKTGPKDKATAKARKMAKAKPEPTHPKTTRAETRQPQTARAKITQALGRPAWTRNPPVPPHRPIALAKLAPAPPAPPKPIPPDPMQDAPALVKTAPVTAPRAGFAKLRPASTALTAIAKPPPARAATRPGVARASAAGLGNPVPPYPWISRQRGEQGRVILDVNVTSEGRAREVRIKRTSGSPRLDQAALKAVRDWRFAPARRAGKPTPGRIDVPISFRLTD